MATSNPRSEGAQKGGAAKKAAPSAKVSNGRNTMKERMQTILARILPSILKELGVASGGHRVAAVAPFGKDGGA